MANAQELKLRAREVQLPEFGFAATLSALYRGTPLG
jgi:hypothetical protein